MRALRLALVTAASLALLLILAMLGIALLFDPNAHKGELERLVTQRTGHRLHLEGPLKLRLFPWFAVDLGPATLGNAPGFSQAPLLSIAQARLGVRVLPLLHGRLEVSDVLLTAPTIRLEVDAGGRGNWSDLLRDRQAAAAPTARASTPATALSIDSIRISAGELTYTDQRSHATHAIHDLSLATGAIAPGKPFDLSLALGESGSDGAEVHIELRTRLTADLPARRYAAEALRLSLSAKGPSLPAGGLTASLQIASAQADLQAQTLRLKQLAVQVAGARLTADLAGEHVLDSPAVTGPVALDVPSLRDLLAALGHPVGAARDPKAWGHATLAANLEASPTALMLNALALQIDDTRIKGRAGIADLHARAVDFDLDVDQLDVDRYRAPAAAPAAKAASRSATPSPPAQLPVSFIRSLAAKGELRARELRFAGLSVARARLAVSAGEGALRLAPVQMELYGGNLQGEVSLDAAREAPIASMSLRLSDLDFAPLLKDAIASTRFSGRGSATIDVGGVGETAPALLRSLHGTVRADVADGAVEGFDLAYELQRGKALLAKQLPPSRSGPARTPFTTLHLAGKVSDGVLASDDTQAITPDLRVTGKGRINLYAQTLDYQLEATVAARASNGNADWGNLAGLTIPVSVTGPLASPAVRPDLGRLVKNELQQRLRGKEQDLKQQLRDKLKGLLGR